jgi:uncharacterized DUF497 family protein
VGVGVGAGAVAGAGIRLDAVPTRQRTPRRRNSGKVSKATTVRRSTPRSGPASLRRPGVTLSSVVVSSGSSRGGATSQTRWAARETARSAESGVAETQGTLLAVAHTYQSTDAGLEQVRIISARTATRRERQQYENEPR